MFYIDTMRRYLLFILCVLCSALYAEGFDYARADSLICSAIYPVDSENRVGDSVFMDPTIPIVPLIGV